MLRRWRIKTRLGSSDTEQRRAMLNSLTANEAKEFQAEIARVAREDLSLREAACEHLNISELGELLKDKNTARCAAQRLALQFGELPIALRQHTEVLQAHFDLAAHNERAQLLAQISDDAEMIGLLLRCNHEQGQALVGPRMNDAFLNQLERASRSHKGWNRFAREQLNQCKSIQSERDDLTQRAQRLEATARKAIAEYAEQQDFAKATLARSHLLALKQEFETITEAAEKVCQELQRYHIDWRLPNGNVFEGVDLSPPEQNPFDQLLARHAGELAAPQIESLERQWQTLCLVEQPSAQQHAELERRIAPVKQRQAAEQRLQDSAWPAPPDLPSKLPEEREAAQALWRLKRDAERWLRDHEITISELRWPENSPLPEAIKQAQTQQIELRAALDQIADHAKGLSERLNEQLKLARQALDEGASQSAKQGLANARKLLARLRADQHRNQQKQLNELSATLGQLTDWQTFATDPKREALCDEMEALAATPLSPESQATRVKRLRSAWRALGKPQNRAQIDLNKRFDAAAELAFAPCRAHFEAESAARQANLERRAALSEELGQFVANANWSTLDYRAAEKILHTARREWRAAHPVPRGAGAAVTKRFEALQSELHGHIKSHWNALANHKEELIRRAQGALELPLGEQIAAVKSLQREWQAAGALPRRRDQELWNSFRAVCDQVFAQRDAADQVVQEEQAALARNAREAGEAFAKILDATEPSSLSRREVAAFKEQFESHRKHIDAAERKRQQQLIEQAEGQLVAAAQAKRVADLELWAAEDQRLAAAQEKDSTLPGYPAAAETRSAAELNELVLLAELASETSSPAHARSERMQLQVEIINGQRQRPVSSELLKTWCAVRPKENSPAVAAMRARFFAAIAASLDGKTTA